MFDLYDINGSKKIHNVAQSGRVEATIPVTEQIVDSNLIGAILVVVSVLYVDRLLLTLTSIGMTSTVLMAGNDFTLYFDSPTGRLSVNTDVVDKTLVKIKGYFYIK